MNFLSSYVDKSFCYKSKDLHFLSGFVVCIWGGRGGKETIMTEIHCVLNKQHCVAITKSSQLTKNPRMLSLKCGTLQGRATDPRAQVEVGAHPWMSQESLCRRADPVAPHILERLGAWAERLSAVQRTSIPPMCNPVCRIVCLFYLQRLNPSFVRGGGGGGRVSSEALMNGISPKLHSGEVL